MVLKEAEGLHGKDKGRPVGWYSGEGPFEWRWRQIHSFVFMGYREAMNFTGLMLGSDGASSHLLMVNNLFAPS